MARQTAVQDSRTIRFGSGKFEVGETEESLVNLGAMRDIQFEELWERVRVMSDNAGPIHVGVRNHRAALQGNLMEIDLENLELIRGGLDNYSVEDGTTVTDYDQVVQDWQYDKLILFDKQSYSNGEKVAPENLTVTGNGTSYTEDTDFYVAQDSNNNFGVVVLDTADTDEAHTLTLNYDYTPAEKKILESGGNLTISPRVVKITNTNEDGKEFSITVFKAEVENGINIELPSDEAEDPAMTEIRLEGDVDTSKDKGKQLFKIEDQQTV